MHLAVGIFTLVMLFSFGQFFTRAVVFFVIITGLVLINLRIRRIRVGFVDWFVDRFERKNAYLPGFGSATYALGVLIPLVFLSDINEIAAVIIVFAVGDSASTLIGRRGTRKIPYNNSKTMEGSAAFFLTGLASYFFIGWEAVILSIAGTLAESLPIEDNISIPVAATIVMVLL